MKKKSRMASLFLAVVVAVTSVMPVFAYGSKQAEPIKEGESEVVLDESTSANVVINGEPTEVVINSGDSVVSDAPIVVPVKAIESALNDLANKKSVKLPVASQVGSKFKGYKVIINGKAKIVKKLTAKQLKKLQKKNGKVEMSPVFTLIKFKVIINKKSVGDVTIKKRTYKSLSYDRPLNMTIVSAGIRNALPEGYKLVGYTANGQAIGVDEYIRSVPDGKKTIKLDIVVEEQKSTVSGNAIAK
ncbi:MAG: hypothetical protein K5686_01395 [Lachnospiraceae bacterium]|nr:hypothetical protein [Lachnospiraceae bacterium]